MTLSNLVRIMCHCKPEPCECADKGQYQEYEACRIVYRHAHDLLKAKTFGERYDAR